MMIPSLVKRKNPCSQSKSSIATLENFSYYMRMAQRKQRTGLSSSNSGFTLIVTLSFMILLTLIAVGLLSLSTISLRNSSLGAARAEARANARLAMMIAIGELQEEMGPDMRVSAESAILEAIQVLLRQLECRERWAHSHDAEVQLQIADA
jgi:hypothetical protein